MTIKIEGYSFEEIVRAHRTAAKIVALYGDSYLPVFRRLHLELEKFNHVMDMKAIASNIASGINSSAEWDKAVTNPVTKNRA